MSIDSETIINEITRMTMSLEIREGRPPEEAIRTGLEQLFLALARAVRTSDCKSALFFPLVFPLEMSLKTEILKWDFRIVAKLKNSFEAVEETKT